MEETLSENRRGCLGNKRFAAFGRCLHGQTTGLGRSTIGSGVRLTMTSRTKQQACQLGVLNAESVTASRIPLIAAQHRRFCEPVERDRKAFSAKSSLPPGRSICDSNISTDAKLSGIAECLHGHRSKPPQKGDGDNANISKHRLVWQIQPARDS